MTTRDAGHDRIRTARTRALEDAGVVAVIRLRSSDALRDVIHALVDGGIRAVEVTMTVPDAIGLIAELAPGLPEGVLLGAGTVLDAATATRVIDAGASFVVSPVFRPEMIAAAHAGSTPMIPGCFSPTEIFTAWQAGADCVKVFPATSLGPSFIKDIRGPLPELKLIPTGGVTLENAGDWIRAGAAGVGIGTALVHPDDVAKGRYADITSKARALMAAVHRAREMRA